jgi:hypothetical protein
MLAYSLVRERIINNNDVSSYYNPSLIELSPENIDNYYKAKALKTES